MAKPLINNVKRGKLVEKEGFCLNYKKQPLDHISCYSSHFAKSNKDHGSRSTKQVGQAVKVPRIKRADKIISMLCGEHEAEDQKIKNRQGLSQGQMTRTAARLTTALGAEAGPN
jgi:hypothetical protein